MSNPKCMKCVHYFVTFDPLRPRGCRKFGFQSLKLPSLLVKEETGQECIAFEERALRSAGGKDDGELDLNDPSLW